MTQKERGDTRRVTAQYLLTVYRDPCTVAVSGARAGARPDRPDVDATSDAATTSRRPPSAASQSRRRRCLTAPHASNHITARVKVIDQQPIDK